MKEYILNFTMPDGKKTSLRRLLNSEMETFTLKNIGKADRKGIVLDSAEPTEINVRSEIKKLIINQQNKN